MDYKQKQQLRKTFLSKGKVNATEAELDEALLDVIECGSSALREFDNPTLASVHAYISQKEREKIPLSDFGDPAERKYPIRNQDDLDAAARLIGRAPKKKQAAIKKRLIQIAKRKGLKLPESWSKE